MPGVEYGPGRPEFTRVLLEGEKNIKKQGKKAGKITQRNQTELNKITKRLNQDTATRRIAKQLEDLSYTKKMTKPRRERLNKLGVLNAGGSFNAKRDVRVRKLMAEAAAINNKAKASKVAKAKKAKAKAAKARRKAAAPAKKAKKAKKVAKKVAKRAR
jgi:hypothetical protein